MPGECEMQVVLLPAIAVRLLAGIASYGVTTAESIQGLSGLRLNLHDAGMPEENGVSVGNEAVLAAPEWAGEKGGCVRILPDP